MKRIKRRAVRALILTPENEILLMRVEEPSDRINIWISPGGAIEPGEKPKTCLIRELFEETGIENPEIGPNIWIRNHDFKWDGKSYTQNETYYLVRSNRFTPTFKNNPDPVEESAFKEFKWWAVEQIETSNEIFAPKNLADYVRQLIIHGPRKKPFETGA